MFLSYESETTPRNMLVARPQTDIANRNCQGKKHSGDTKTHARALEDLSHAPGQPKHVIGPLPYILMYILREREREIDTDWHTNKDLNVIHTYKYVYRYMTYDVWIYVYSHVHACSGGPFDSAFDSEATGSFFGSGFATILGPAVLAFALIHDGRVIRWATYI